MRRGLRWLLTMSHQTVFAYRKSGSYTSHMIEISDWPKRCRDAPTTLNNRIKVQMMCWSADTAPDQPPRLLHRNGHSKDLVAASSGPPQGWSYPERHHSPKTSVWAVSSELPCRWSSCPWGSVADKGSASRPGMKTWLARRPAASLARLTNREPIAERERCRAKCQIVSWGRRRHSLTVASLDAGNQSEGRGRGLTLGDGAGEKAVAAPRRWVWHWLWRNNWQTIRRVSNQIMLGWTRMV